MSSTRIIIIGALAGAAITIVTAIFYIARDIESWFLITDLIVGPGSLLAWLFITGDTTNSSAEFIAWGLIFSIPINSLVGALPGIGIELWRWFMCNQRRHGRCLNCGYDLRGTPAGISRCPKCGAENSW